MFLLWLFFPVVIVPFVVVPFVVVVVVVVGRLMPTSDRAGRLAVPVVVVFSCFFLFCFCSFCCCCCCCWAVDADIRSGGEARATLAFVGFATHHH